MPRPAGDARNRSAARARAGNRARLVAPLLAFRAAAGRSRCRAMGLLVGATLAATTGLGLQQPPAAAADLPGTLQEVGHSDLGGRGLNAALALAGSCAYVGSRGQGAVEIVDVSDPAQPHVVNTISGRPLTTSRELRTVPDRKLLVVLSYALGRGGVNRLDLYRWDADCSHPAPLGSYDFGGRPPHEFYLWQDPGGARLLLFTSMFSGGAGDLQVVDASNPSAPVLAGTWSPPIGLLHSISLSADGHRAYLSMWTGGLLVADSSQFTTGQPNPQLSLLTPVGSVLRPLAGGNVHSAVQLPGKDLLMLTDERYPPACPYGPARIADVSNPAQPHQLGGELAAPENDPATCRNSPVGTYTSHNPTLVGDLGLISWYSSGLQVFDLANPAQPARLAEFRPQAIEPGARDPQLGATSTLTWSYPIVRDGLVYVADINQGLYVLRYQGPHQEQLQQVAFAEGNSNLARLRPATPSPSPPATPTASPRPVTRVAPSPAGAALRPRPVLLAATVAALAVLAVLALLGVLVYTARTRRRGPLR